MARASLKRVLRGETRDAIAELAAMLPDPLRIEDEQGRALLPAGPGFVFAERHPVRCGDAEVGAVVGGKGADRVARVLSELCEREAEKLALADETLGRYKELTLLYDVGEKLAHVLEVEEVASLVVAEARAFLRASGASLLLLDRRRNVLEPVATTGDEPTSRRGLAVGGGLEARVLASGRAELVEDVLATEVGRGLEPGVRSLLCAPLRSGEQVFGILRVTHERPAAWNAGHLKLVGALVGNAATAIRHAMLHRERLQEQALRQQVERFASPAMLEAALSDRATPPRSSAVLFADLGELARFAEAALPPEELLAIVQRATAVSLSALMQRGATVQLSQDEILVALFASDEPFADLAARAVAAASAIARATDRRLGGFAERSPGLAIARAELVEGAAERDVLAALSSAVSMQQIADGRVLVDEHVAAAIGDAAHAVVAVNDAPSGRIYEVRS